MIKEVKFFLGAILCFVFIGAQAQKVPEAFRAQIKKETISAFNKAADRYEKKEQNKIEGVVTADPKRFYISLADMQDQIFLVVGKRDNDDEKVVEYKCQSKGRYYQIEITYNKNKLILTGGGEKHTYNLGKFVIPANEKRPEKKRK